MIDYPSAQVSSKYETINGDNAAVYWAEPNNATVVWDIARKNTFLGGGEVARADAFLSTYIADSAATERTFALITLGVLHSERAKTSKLIEIAETLRQHQLAPWEKYWQKYLATRVAMDAGDSVNAIANLTWLIEHARMSLKQQITDVSRFCLVSNVITTIGKRYCRRLKLLCSRARRNSVTEQYASAHSW